MLDRIQRVLRRLAPPRVDRFELQREMREQDPAFERVQKVQGEFIDALTAKGILDGEAIRREREFWQRAHRGGKPS